jgi:hypothetical protein
MNRWAWTAVGIAGASLIISAIARGAFTTSATSPQTLQAVPDFLPPLATGSQIVGSAPGAVAPGEQYQVYAQVADQGNPPAGTQSVTADLSAISGSGSAVPLTAGSYTVGGSSFNFRSASQTASAGLTNGSTEHYALTMTDALGQAATQTGYSVSVQVACAASAITADNGGKKAGEVDEGDVITYTFTVPVANASVLPGWTSGIALVRVDLADAGGRDQVTISSFTGGTSTRLGVIDTKADYAGGKDRTFDGSMNQGGNTVVVTVGPRRSGGNPPSVSQNTAMTWTPGVGLTDEQGAACATTPVTQPTVRRNF